MTTIAERVAKGAAFLDEREPGWDTRIDLDTLDLMAPCRCVLGQLTTDLQEQYEDDDDPDYWGMALKKYGLRRWFRDPLPGDDRATDADYGFNTDGLISAYGILTAEWKRVITARREAGAS